jgi:hypothetical protein
VVGPQRLLLNGEGAAIERLGFLVAPSVAVELGYVDEACGGVRVVGRKLFFADCEGALQERLGLLVSALVLVDGG